MKKSLQIHARVYADILARLFLAQSIGGRLAVVSRGARYLSLGVRLTDPRRLKQAMGISEPLALAAKVESVIPARRVGLVLYQLQLQASFWQFYTRADVTGLQVGLAERRIPVEFSFADAPHALFAGTSGSGKTEAIKSALVALTQTHPPDALGLIVIDTNGELDDFRNCAHLIMPIATDAKAAADALTYAHRELAHRKANSIKDGKRLVLVIDEVSDLTAAPGNVAMLKDIAKQGRKYRLNLMVGNQKPTQKELPAILDNLLNRFIGQVDNAQNSAMLTGHSGLEAHKLTGRGDFLHVTTGGSVTRFQVAQATAADFKRLERADVKPVEIAPGPVIELPDMPTKRAGRPKTMIDPATLALYVHKAHRLSIAQANDVLGFSRRKHNYYKQFTADFLAELKRLRGIAQ